MKTTNFGINSFSDKLIENQLSKFSKPEFLSKSKNFNDVLKKSEDSKEKNKNKFGKQDIHFEKLTNRLSDELKSGTTANKDLLSSLFDDKNLLGGALGIEQKLDFNNTKNLTSDQKAQKLVQESMLGKENHLSKTNLTSIDDLNKSEDKFDISKLNDKSKIKLDDSFKQVDKNQTIDLNNSAKASKQDLADKNTKLGLNTNDLKSKNDLLLKNTLRSKNIESKNKLGSLKAAELYEKQQPAERSGAQFKGQITEGNVAGSASNKAKIIKPIAIQKTNSDSLKNDLMPNASDIEQQLETKDIATKDFAKVMDLKEQFKSEGIEDIIKNAQFLAKKGGGEMKLLLNPKGLGAVRLKVFMEENQLKVEMATETKEAQEVIESTLSELRKALADGQLDVESINIETFEKLAEFAAGEDANKENQFAKDFLSEFRHDNNKFRSGLVDFPSVKRRNSQILEPSVINSTKNIKSERKLDLVA